MENNWIKTSERMPAFVEQSCNGYCSSECVLILLPEKQRTIAKFIQDRTGEKYWVNDIGDYIYQNGLVTHWHKLPEIPEN